MNLSMYKLQMASLILLVFIGILHSRTKQKKKSNRLFTAMNIASIVQVTLDGITVYMLRNPKQISDLYCRATYIVYMWVMVVVCYLMYQYLIAMIEEEIQETIRKNWFLWGWCILANIGIVTLPFQFQATPVGNYAYGPAVVVVYASIAEFLTFNVVNLLVYRKRIETKKQYAMWVATASCAIVTFFQVCIPTMGISCLSTVLMNLGIYLTVENPDALLVEKLKKETERADAANNAKSTFLAHMSHEARTPINAVLGMNEMILRETADPSIRSYATDIQSSARALLSIINDVLDITKIESGKLSIVPTEYKFSELLRDVVNMVSVKAKAKQLSFLVEVDETIPKRLYGDDIRIRQVLLNLLNNAVKYTHKGSVTLYVKNCESKDGYVTLGFLVQDTGIGMKEEDIPNLFVPFQRFDEANNRNIEGSGLGMSITIELLEMMDTNLEVVSEYGKGSEFSFVLRQKIVKEKPVGKLGKVLSTAPEPKPYEAKFVAPEAEILLVDDNEMNRRVFRNLLKRTEVRITEAASGKECLEKAAEKRYDIIFMDHMMPGMDGVETKRELEKRPNSPNRETPVVMLTANAIAGAKEQYYEEGFDAFLAKPIVPKKLEKVVRSFLPKELLHSVEKKEAGENENQKESSETVELPMIDGLDWSYARLHFSSVEEVFELLGRFYAVIESDAAELELYYGDIRQEISRGNFQIKVHSMKNSAATLGIIPLAGMAKVLEDAAREHDYVVIDTMLPVFLRKWREYKGRLREFSQEDKTLLLAEEHMSEIKVILEQVKQAATDMDIDELDRLLEVLENYKFEGEWQEKMEGIRVAIQNFDVDTLQEMDV